MKQVDSQTIHQSLYTGFIDMTHPSSISLRPRLITNNRQTHQKVLMTIDEELSSCTSFSIAVAFITRDGVASLMQTLLDLAQRGIRGRLLTTDYLEFNDPEALHTLMDLPFLDIRIFHGNLHTKGYLFHHDNGTINLIVGSANLTAQALSTNQEWNIRVTSTQNGEIIHQAFSEFERMWANSVELSQAWLIHYEKRRDATRNRSGWVRIDQQGGPPPSPLIIEQANESVRRIETLELNKMQVEAMASLQTLRNRGEKKALIVSATGTGKTHLAAFDAKSCKPDRLLYIVHRETILLKSLQTFKSVFGDDHPITFGILGGGKKDFDEDFIFASIATLSRDDVLAKFGKHHFDYIIVDEVHKAGADSYRKVLAYFEPDFTLGMTATPERTDGQDIYELFDHNLAYNIRLHKALEHNLLCQFHYYGITDLVVDGNAVDDKSKVSFLTNDARALHIKKAIDTYSMHEKRKRGLIFCRTVKEAKLLSEQLFVLGLRTLAVTGEDPEPVREEAIRRLESPNAPDMLEYLVTVDIFNEGIDIPSLNQIVMARPTQSAIVFVQQLGRGLRKCKEKPFLTVIDFVGNYSNNFLIPIALYGDISYNKDTIRKMMVSGNLMITGESTVNFDRISRQRIFKSIDSTSLNRIPILKEQYKKLKTQLGRIPRLMDFIEAGEFDPLQFLTQFNSYPLLLDKFEDKTKNSLSPLELKSLRFFSQELANGKRPHELLLLKLLANSGRISKSEFASQLISDFDIKLKEADLLSASRILTNGFFIESARILFGDIRYLEIADDLIKPSTQFLQLLDSKQYREAFHDVIDLGLANFEKRYNNELQQSNGLVLYEKYSRKDACRMLDWENNEESTIYGYKVKHNTCPVFVTYHKRDDIEASTAYPDEFVNQEIFSWMTRSRRTLATDELKEILAQQDYGLAISLFIKKSDGEGTDFYYIGDVDVIPGRAKETTIKDENGKDLPIVNILFHLQHPCKNDLYTYLIEEDDEKQESKSKNQQ